ncbi:MAG: hypothetical protein IPK04_06505 [Bdellovibrionales bacterium]|nr:hypothetical protein [Bdellovibrionales bacterium]
MIWDEDSYIAAAAHISQRYSLDVNFEVPPLSKIYMALWVPSKFEAYTIPIEDNVRASHGNMPLVYFDKLNEEEKKELMQAVRNGQVLLFSMSLLLILGYTFFLLKLVNTTRWLTWSLVSAVLILSPQFFTWTTIAFTDGMVIFVLSVIATFSHFFLSKCIACSTRRQNLIHFCFGILVGLAMLSKGSLVGFGVALLLSWVFASYLATRRFFLPLVVSVAGVLICLHAWTLPDHLLWMDLGSSRLTYRQWGSFFAKSWGQETGLLMSLVFLLNKCFIIPDIFPSIISFNLNIVTSNLQVIFLVSRLTRTYFIASSIFLENFTFGICFDF